MLQITASTRIFICLSAVDFRKGIDGLSAVCRNQLVKDPLSGAMFVFRNKKRTTIRLLLYDGQGFWLCSKRLSQGRFGWWPKDDPEIDARSLQTLLWNGNPRAAQFGSDWKKIKAH